MLRALVGSAPGKSFSLKAKHAVVVGRIRKGQLRAVQLEIPEFERVVVRFSGKLMNRCFVLEAADEPNRFDFPPFFIEGNYRVVEKINHPQRAGETFRSFVPQ